MKTKLLLGLALVLSGVWLNLNSNAAIIYPQEPDGGRQMAMQYVNCLVGTNLAECIGINTTNDLTIAPPLSEYRPGNPTKGQLLTGATSGRAGWRMWEYIFMRGTNAVANANLEADAKTRKPIKCSRFGASILDQEIVVALHKAEQIHQVQKQDYEARLLHAEWLDFAAIWLHGETNDIILPLPNPYCQINAYEPYSDSEVIKALNPLAQQRLKQLSDFNFNDLP